MSDTPRIAPPRRGPYANTARRKAEIVAAAASVFMRSGYRGGSLREIARDLELSFTSVKHHFPTKEHLLIAVLEEYDSLETEQLNRDIALLGVVDAAIALAVRNLDKPETERLLAVMSAEASSSDHPAHEWFVRRYENIRNSMAAGIRTASEAEAIPFVADADFVASAFVALWDGLQLQWLIDPRFDMIDRLRRGFEAILREGSR
ncbi:TetR/AcrR family transcriptional regulator [Microbacterium sp. YMB-B2]|uniref:TetR/AcrR family transcriptional regulator n=1 Tax=Microbacterium tenebrionis TaxID=2830665 RepID=A0A9X1S031_9MICO|nr:TetR/AcrR family transcriptional regulator [Microbacterium tenebrionis]MCC2028872.1 TetR/AcrR family transcriptional regulator [Microbacterium tenebrionis]